MKVYIGRYPSHKKGVEPKERKVRIRIDKWDTWSMDHTLALIIHPMLVQLRATQHGAPNTDDEPGMPEHLLHSAAAPKENEWDTDSNHFDRWNWILDEMIWAFSQELLEDEDEQFHSGEMDVLWQALDKDHNPIGEPKHISDRTKLKGVAFYQMVDGPNHTWKTDREAMDKHYERKKNALKMFGKYYFNLWD